MNRLFDWVSSTPPSWASESILNWEDVFLRQGAGDMMSFVTRRVYESNSLIDMRDIVGQRDHYAGQTWYEAATDPQYREGKMRHCFKKFDENPDYYFNGEINNELSVSRLNTGPWYSDNGGNHRTVVGKFACEYLYQKTGVYPLVKGVSKIHYVVDIPAYDIYCMLRETFDVGVHVNLNQIEQPTANNSITDYQLEFRVTDYRYGRNQPRNEILSSKNFIRFGKHVLKTNGVLSWKERMTDLWRWWVIGDMERLIYK